MRNPLVWLKTSPAYVQRYPEAGMCLANVRYAFDIPALYPSAAVAGEHADCLDGHRYKSAPACRPYFWSGGSHGFGHVAITDGYTLLGRNLRVWTVDWPNARGVRDGKWRRVRVDAITRTWGLKPMGYGQSLNGVDL